MSGQGWGTCPKGGQAMGVRAIPVQNLGMKALFFGLCIFAFRQEGQLRVVVAGGWSGGDLASAEV